MSEAKFTPGPWRTITRSDGLKNIYAGITDVALCVRPRDSDLIAAAPELLAALELCLKNSEFRRTSGAESGPMIEREIEAARAAINKAKGV